MASHAGLIYVLETKNGYIDKEGNVVSNIVDAYPINFYQFGFGPSAFEIYEKLGFDGNIKPNEIRVHTIVPSYEGRIDKIRAFYQKMDFSFEDSIYKAYEDYYIYNLDDSIKFKNYINNLGEQIISYFKRKSFSEMITVGEKQLNLYKSCEINKAEYEGFVEEFYCDIGKIYKYSIPLKKPNIERYFNLTEEEQNYYNNWQNEGLVDFLRKEIDINRFKCGLQYEFKILEIGITDYKFIIYCNDINFHLIDLIENKIRDYYSMREMHITRMFGSYIILQKEHNELMAKKATPIPINYCPLMIKLLREVGGDLADKLIESLKVDDEKIQTKMMCELINKVVIKGGYFDTNRPLNSCEDNVLFGASETMSSAFKTKMIDAAVIVSNNLGTIITTNEFNTQGAVKRMTGLFYTSPNKNIYNSAIESGIIPVFPYTATINQLAGVKKAISLGYRKIAVSVAANDNYLHEKLSELEKENNIVIYKFGLCSTGIDKSTAEKMQESADVIWSCASKYVKELIEPNALAQVGIKIPVHIMTKQGWNIIKNHLSLMNNQNNLEDILLQQGNEKPVLLNSDDSIKILKKKNLHNCSDCPSPCI